MNQEFVRFGPWQILIKVTNVLCSDGKFRTFWAQGEPDTFFTQPGRVKVKGKTVTGFIWADTTFPYGVDTIFKFTANQWMKNAGELPQWKDAVIPNLNSVLN